MKFLPLLLAITVIVFGYDRAAAQTAVYDPTTGELCLKDLVSVGRIQLLTSDNGGLDELRFENANDLGGIVSATGDQQIDWIFFSAGNGGPYNLGAVLPIGRPQSALDSEYFLGILIAGGAEIDPRANPIAITESLVGHTSGTPFCEIPEPSMEMLAGIGMLSIVAAGRHHKVSRI